MRIHDIAYVALFAALTAVLGLIPRIDVTAFAVPITAQSLGPMLAGSIIGARRGALSQALFLFLVAAGLPLLTGGRGGLGVFAGPSAGFLFAFPLAAGLIGWLTQRLWRRLGFGEALLANLVGGVALVYACGVPVLAAVTGMSLAGAALATSIFLPGDCIKAVVAALVATFVKRGYPLIEQRENGHAP